jgi:hypothetical protein
MGDEKKEENVKEKGKRQTTKEKLKLQGNVKKYKRGKNREGSVINKFWRIIGRG